MPPMRGKPGSLGCSCLPFRECRSSHDGCADYTQQVERFAAALGNLCQGEVAVMWNRVWIGLVLTLGGLGLPAGSTLGADESFVSADGWRPKRRPAAGQHVTASAGQVAKPFRLDAGQPPAGLAENASTPFRWQDEAVGRVTEQSPALVHDTRLSADGWRSKTAGVQPAGHWCRCQHSRVCGHCGRQRPALAVYQDPVSETDSLQASDHAVFAEAHDKSPVLDQLRLVMERVGHQVQQSLGRF